MSATEGVGAFHPNPWRRLSESEITLLHTYCGPQFKTQFATVRPQIVNGAQVWNLTCSGYSIMVQANTSGTYWYVYNHPSTLVFAQKLPERLPTVQMRRLQGVPSMHTTAHWPGLGAPDGMDDVESADGLGQTLPPDASEQAAAVAMNDALNAHGYKESDMGLYKAFQRAVGLNPDGFPGEKTMQELKDVLFALGVEIAPVTVYPWHSAPGSSGYDGVNAPLWSDWSDGAPPIPSGGATPPTSSTPGTTTVTTTTVTGGAPNNKAILLVGGAAAAVAGGLGYWYWKKHRRGR
jgi:hypothetical protein